MPRSLIGRYDCGMYSTVPVFALLFSLLFALALGLLGLVTLSTGMPPGGRVPEVAQAENVITGVVASVDADHLVIIVRTRFGRAQSFAVSSADLLKGISEGDAISAELDAQGVARRITKTAGR